MLGGFDLYCRWLAHFREAKGLQPHAQPEDPWEMHSDEDRAAWIALAAELIPKENA